MSSYFGLQSYGMGSGFKRTYNRLIVLKRYQQFAAGWLYCSIYSEIFLHVVKPFFTLYKPIYQGT